MKPKFYLGILLILLVALVVIWAYYTTPRVPLFQKEGTAPAPPGAVSSVSSTVSPIFWGMKLVNETVSDQELDELQALGLKVLSGEWGMSEATAAEVLSLLSRVEARGMKLVINFSDGAAWGYREDGSDSPRKKPVWQKRKIQRYLKKIYAHPGIYGYDISNEAGENLPNGERFRITLAQLQAAARDVRAIDPNRPILMRMHYWDEEDGDFGARNPFAAGIADIVMLNLYSNYSEDRTTPLLPNMLEDSGQILVDKILAVDPNVRVWLSLAAFQEMPYFVKPSITDLVRDIDAALVITGIESIGFFGWGPERYPEEPPGWYLPRDGVDLLSVIQEFISL
mgnify:CR=1 FL=1